MKSALLALAASAAAAFAAEPAALTLADFTSPDGKPAPAGWAAESDGSIHLKGGGNLISRNEYANFEIEWEWKLVTGGNNGLKYWVIPIGEKKEWLGIEYQMIDDHKHPDGIRGGSHTTASIYDIKEVAADKPFKPVSEWNASKVVAKDGKIEHWLNGKLVAEADTRSEEWKALIARSKFKNKKGFAPGKGRIMLTDHKDETWYRNIRIREL